MKFKQLFLISLSGLAIASCGGGSSSSGGGNEEQANNNISSEEISQATISTLGTAISSSNGDNTSPFTVNTTNAAIEQLSTSISPYLNGPNNFQINATETQSETIIGNCATSPGSYTAFSSTTTPDNNDIYPISTYVDFDFNNYCIEFFVGESPYRTVWNGTVIFDSLFTSQNDRSHYYLWDLSYTSSTPEGTEINSYYVSETCAIRGDNPMVCTETYNYEADDGTEYELADTTVDGDNSDGYSIEGAVSDDNGNTYTISFEGLKTCANGNFSEGSGTIAINNTNSIFIEFIDCNTFSVTYEGVSEIYTY